MSESKRVGLTDGVELLAQWEGPAILEPGLLFDERQAIQPTAKGNAAEFAAWIAVTALSGSDDSGAAKAIRAKVIGVLSNWLQRFGQAKIDEVKRELVQRMQGSRGNRKITEEELLERIDRLFSEIKG